MGWSNPVVEDWPSHIVRGAVDFDEDGDGPLPLKTIFYGTFGWVSDVRVEGIAAWDGAFWSAFPGGSDISLKIETMVTIDWDGAGLSLPSLYAGGSFTSINGIPAERLARYDGGSWHGLTDGVPAFQYGTLKKLVVLDEDDNGPIAPRLFALGSTLVEIVGSDFVLVGESLPSDFIEQDIVVADLDGDGPEPPSLIRSGRSGNPSVMEVDRWTGTAWQRLGGTFNSQVNKMVIYDANPGGPRAPELHATGGFTQVGGVPIRGLARWRSGQWENIEIPLNGSANVMSVAVGDDDGGGPRRNSIFVAGLFAVPGTLNPQPISFGRWDGEKWEDLTEAQLVRESMAPVTVTINGERVFRWFGYKVGPRFVYWDSRQWVEYTNSASTMQRAMFHYDPDGPGSLGHRIVVGTTNLECINDGVSETIAEWDGRRWARLGSNELNGLEFQSISRFDFDADGPLPPQFVVAGRFLFGGEYYAAATLANDVWIPLGDSRIGSSILEMGRRLSVFSESSGTPVLYLGGRFPSLGGNTAMTHIARWTPGVGWTALPGPLDQLVVEMAVHDIDGNGPIPASLYVAGPLTIGGMSVSGIAGWDGATWSALTDISTGEINPPFSITIMRSFEESPSRYVLCASGSASATGYKYAAKWNGAHWEPMGSALTGELTALAVDDLHVDPASTFSLYGSSGGRLVRWTGVEWEFLTSGPQVAKAISPVDFDGTGPLHPVLVASGTFGNVTFNSPGGIETRRVPGMATWGSRHPYYFATPWNRSIAAGDRLSLKVATGGAEPITFAWTRDGVTLTDGGAISGATTRELIINPVGFGDSGQYECIATNACGSIPSGPTIVRVCAALANGDLNSDGHVDGRDIKPFVEYWTIVPSPESDCAVDLTHNGVRDPEDIVWFIGRLLAP